MIKSGPPNFHSLFKFREVAITDDEIAAPFSQWLDQMVLVWHPAGRFNPRETNGDYGVAFQVDLGDRFGRAYFYGFRQERYELAVLRSLAMGRSLVFDVGANFGLYSVTLAKVLREGGIVHAFEPHDKAASLLRQNLMLNKLKNVRHHAIGVSDSEGTADFHFANESAFSGLSDTRRAHIDKVESIQVRRLDSVWVEIGKPPVDILKVDVEGYEAAVLNGAEGLFEQSPDIVAMVEVSRKNLSEQQTIDIRDRMRKLAQRGYAFWQIDARAEAGASEVSGEILGDSDLGSDGNLFIVRARSAREEELLSAFGEAKSERLRRDKSISPEMRDVLAALLKEISRIDEMRTFQRPVSPARRRGSPVNGHTARPILPVAPSSCDVTSPDNAEVLRELMQRTAHPSALAGSVQVADQRHARGSSRPMREVEIAGLTAIVRGDGSTRPFIETIETLQAIDSAVPLEIIAVVLGPEAPVIRADIPPTTLIRVPGPGQVASIRHPTLLGVGLRASRSSHVLVLDAGCVVEPRVLQQMVKVWRDRAGRSDGALAGLAFPAQDSDKARDFAVVKTLGGRLTVGQGLYGREAVANVGFLDEDHFTTEIAEEDLALRLWYAGYRIEVCEDVRVKRATGAPQSLPDAIRTDSKLLEQRWLGIFHSPSLPHLFLPREVVKYAAR